MSENAASDITHHIAARLRALRAARGLTLEALAAQSEVSRSMISAIERAESSPTAVTLERLAAALGVSLAALFERPAGAPVARRADQPEWRDPASGYLRRNLSPAGAGSAIQLVEVHFPPGASVSYETGPRATAQHQQVWVLEGTIEIRVGADAHRLDAGDCLAFVLDRPTGFRNPGAAPARYLVAIAAGIA